MFFALKEVSFAKMRTMDNIVGDDHNQKPIDKV